MYQQKNIYEVDQELGGGELSLSACRGWGIDLPPRKKKKLQIPRGGGGMPGEGGMVKSQLLNHDKHLKFEGFRSNVHVQSRLFDYLKHIT